MLRLLLLLCLCVFALPAEAGRILFIPLDNRPVSLSYEVDTMRKAGWEVLIPPSELIADNEKDGAPDALLTWLEDNLPGSSAIVASGDSLLYGGLVASRTHEIEQSVLDKRVERLLNFKRQHRPVPFYLFITVMRSPKASSAPVEPAYYAEYGPRLFRLGALRDKAETGNLRRKEKAELAKLRQEIPAEILTDLYQRREKNLLVTEKLLAGTETGAFDYFLLGRDDTAPFSDAHRDARKLASVTALQEERKVRFFAGADQLGLLLLNRAGNKLFGLTPIVYAYYTDGVGEKTVPSYEDDRVGANVRSQILAAGAWPAPGVKNADLVLAVNTPADGITLGADNPLNLTLLTPEKQKFLLRAETYLAEGKKVGIADVAYGNGSDNALVNGLFAGGTSWRLSAYSGWNTAANTIGFALVQGLQAANMQEQDKNDLLAVRYFDEWAYQANVRGQIRSQIVWPRQWTDGKFSPEQKAELEQAITVGIAKFTAPYMSTGFVREWRFTLPWNRTFEVDVERVR